MAGSPNSATDLVPDLQSFDRFWKNENRTLIQDLLHLLHLVKNRHNIEIKLAHLFLSIPI